MRRSRNASAGLGRRGGARRAPRSGVGAARLAVPMVVGAMVAGCMGLPQSSTVQQGLEIGPPAVAPLRVRFEPPRAGATQLEIVRGFLAATADLDEDSAAARAFLTGPALRSWDPLAGVVIHAGQAAPVITASSATAVRLQVTAEAVIAADGRYTELPVGSTRTASLRLAKNPDGQWRITELPDDFGMWLSRSNTEQTFAPFRVHYLAVAATSRTLVPDVRWLPLVGRGVPTTLARAQLEPVPRYLQGAVKSGIPTGTTLSVDAVAIDAGTAVVDMSRRLLDAVPQDQRGAWAQMLATLDQTPGVSRLDLWVDGTPLQLADTRSPAQTLGDLGYAGPGAVGGQRLITRSARHLAVVERAALRGRTEQLPGKAGEAPPVLPEPGNEWTALAAPAALTELAAVDGSRTAAQRWSTSTGSGSRLPIVGRDLTPPAYDRFGVLWVAGRDNRGRPAIWAIRPGAPATEAPARVSWPALDGADIEAIRVAADGQRAAVIVRSTAQGVRVLVAGVIRDGRGVPVRLTEPIRVGGALVDARDLTWIDDITLGVLGRWASDRQTRPYLVPLARHSVPWATVPDPARIVATGDGQRGVLVLTRAGVVLTPTGSRWQELARLSDVVVPGT